MASLYDRLNRAMPIAKKQGTRQTVDSCLVRQTVFELGSNRFSFLPAKTMAYLSGKPAETGYAPDELLFLDTETTGLSHGAGTVAFLIGLGYVKDTQFMVNQFLMRDYHLEPEMLQLLAQRLQHTQCLVTFNGASFDLPLLQSRFTLHRMDNKLSDYSHIDLLHASRRVFKLRLGRCNLTRLENELLHVSRQDDLPGSEVPARYFSYLKTGDERLLEDVLRHNQQDILSLYHLLNHLKQAHENPLESAHHADLISLGRIYERHQETGKAVECYRACTDLALRDMARLRLADLYRRQRKYQDAVEVYESLLENGKYDGRIYIALAKLYEHRFLNPGRALDIARQGMVYCSERMGVSALSKAHYHDLEHRSIRLFRKVEKQRNGIS